MNHGKTGNVIDDLNSLFHTGESICMSICTYCISMHTYVCIYVSIYIYIHICIYAHHIRMFIYDNLTLAFFVHPTTETKKPGAVGVMQALICGTAPQRRGTIKTWNRGFIGR